MSYKKTLGWCALSLALLLADNLQAQRQMEKLGRGVVVLHSATTQAYVGWRLLATDPEGVGFNVYRSANGGAAVKLNSAVITNTTDYLDTTATFTVSNSWYVKPVINGVEMAASAPYSLAANSPVRQYVPIPLQPVAGGGAPPYDVKFCWVGDFDGDGEFDYLVDRLSTVTATNQYLQAYKRDGTLLWQMDMGYNSVNQYNIEPGASAISIGHGDCVTVYDLDGDGKAEVCVRTAKGVIYSDGTTNNGPDDVTQYLSILDGMTGHELARATITNLWPGDGPMNGHFGIMYCDGVRPSVLLHMENRNSSQAFQRETMTYDYRNGQLTRRWFFTPPPGANLSWGHQIRIMDVNHDGIDDLVEIGSARNGANGQTLFDTELIHGDRFHITDIDPDRPGLEMFSIQQNNSTLLATALIDMGSGSLIKKWYASGIVDVGRGCALDLTPNSRGYEFFSTQAGIFDAKGNQLYVNSVWPPEAIWWDADVLREFEDGAGSGALSPVINKFNSATGNSDRLYSLYSEDGGCHQAYGGRAAVWGDLFGDWREEFMVVANDYNSVRIYTTKIAATNRIYCLAQNPAYRCQMTCRGYYQASYVDYSLGNGMPAIPVPPLSDAKLVWRGAASSTWDTSAANWYTNNLWISNDTAVAYTAGDTVLFDTTGSNSSAITLSGSLTPGEVRIHSPKSYTFSGSGAISGAAKVTKGGAGRLTFTGTNTYTGATLISEGEFLVNGSLPNSPVTIRGGVWLDGRLSGSGYVGGAVTINEGGGVSPGQGTNSPGTLTLTNTLKLTGRTLNDFDLSDDPTGVTKTNDRLVVNGALTLQGTNTFVIRKLNATLPAGVYPLITYTSTLIGGLTNLTFTGIPGLPAVLTNPPGQIALLVKSARSPSTISWTGGSGGNAWNLLTTSNFLNGASKDMFAPNDTVRFDNIGASNLTVMLTGDLTPTNVVVDSTTNYTFAGSGAIIGACSLTKTNSGTLTISALNNTYTGKTIIAGGTVIVPELDAIGFPSPLGNPPGGVTNLVLSGNSTLRITGESYTDRGLTLSSGTNTIDVTNSADQVTIAGQLIGAGGLAKAGAGTLALTVSNSYSGGTIISGGKIALGSSAGNMYGVGSGLVTLSNGTLSMINIQNYDVAPWSLYVPANTTNRLEVDGRCTLTGALTGGGTLTLWTPYVRTDFSGNWSAFTGQINVISDSDGGDFRCNNSSGYPNVRLNLGALVSLQNRLDTSPTIPIGELSGAAGCNASASGGNNGLAVTWSVGGLNTSATFAGNTYNGISFIKVGTGTWTWSGTNAHTGTTTVSGGTLLINGDATAAPGNISVGAAGTLGGIGLIGGNATVSGKLNPGSNAIGTLTFGGNLTFNSGSTALIEINRTAATKDLVSVAGTLTYAGTLSVTNLAGTLANGDSFKVFNATTYAGSFTSYSLPTLGSGLAWNTSGLLTSGTLAVISTNVLPSAPANPSNLVATAVSYSQINLTWIDNATNETAYLVEISTNNVNFSEIASLGAGTTNHSSTGLNGSTLYYYRVRANNAGGYSAYSAVASATTPAAPATLFWRGDGLSNVWDTGVTANWRSNGVALVFTAGADAIFDDTGSNNVSVTLSGAIVPDTVTVGASKNYTFVGGSLSGSAVLTKTNTGTLTIANVNTNTGGTLIAGGGITVNTGGSIGSGQITLAGGTLTSAYNSSTTVVFGQNIQVADGTTNTISMSQRTELSGTLTGDGNLNVSAPSTIGSGGTRNYWRGKTSLFTGTLNISGGGKLDLKFNGEAFDGFINANVTISNETVDTWNYSGGGTLNLGALTGNASARLQGSQAGGGTTLSIGALNLDTTFAGTIENGSVGTATLTKVGAGTLTLTGTNTYSGVTTVSAGTLQIGDAGATGTLGTNTVLNNATLAFNRANNLADAGVISGTGKIVQDGDGVVTFTQNHTYSGQTLINSGTLALTGNGSFSNSAAVAIAAGATLDVSGRTDGSVTFVNSQVVSGVGAVNGDAVFTGSTKLQPGGSGVGTLTFSNNLTLGSGVTNYFELTNSTTVGSGVNDLVVVGGNLTAGGKVGITVLGPSPLKRGVYRLFNVGGTLSGSFAGAPLFMSGSTSWPYGLDVSTPGQVNLVVSNAAPVANDNFYTQPLGADLKISIASLLANDTDAEGDALTLLSFDSVTTNGLEVTSNGDNLIIPANDADDRFSYTISDGYGGVATADVVITAGQPMSGRIVNGEWLGAAARLQFSATPGYTYAVHRATNIFFSGTVTAVATTNPPPGGLFSITDGFNDLGSVVPSQIYYRLIYLP